MKEQLIGKKDINGKEVKEGDIVKTDSGALQYVAWREDMNRFVLRFPTGGSCDITNNIEVVDSIYTNQDFLKSV